MRLQFDPDGSVQVRTGKVELGQGILTALAQIAVEELGLDPAQVRVLAADTAFGPDEGITSGSLSVQDAGAALRRACAEARPRPAGAPAQVGRSLPRIDLPAKFAGAPVFIHDLAPDGLLHGRVLHPPQPDARLLEADTAAAAALDGVMEVLCDGALVGLIAARSRDADRALALLHTRVRWQPAAAWVDDDAAFDAAHEGTLVDEHGACPTHAPARTLRACYRKPWIAHASIAPSCALAQWHGDGVGDGLGGLTVWTHSQGIFHLRRDLALAFGLAPEAVRVRHVEGAGCYGHNGADDVAFDAAWLARRVPGRPVRVLWTRADEMTRAPLGPAMQMQLEADLDAQGRVLHWRHRVWSAGHSRRPGRSATPALLGSWQTAQPFDAPASINMPIATGGGAERNARPGYALPAWQVFRHDVTAPQPRSSALRALGAFGNVFAAESFVDEIAQATGIDPLAWRRTHLTHDPRALAVLESAAAHAGWGTRVRQEGIGHGLAYARYKGSGAWCAVVAEVEAGATLRVRRLTVAVDVGLAVNPDGVVAQTEGGAIQATSWTLKEAVSVAADGVQGSSWEHYPILRFSEVPQVDVHVVESGEPSLGAGEAALGPTAAAIANALFDALGVRVRGLPLTPERIVAAMDAPEP